MATLLNFHDDIHPLLINLINGVVLTLYYCSKSHLLQSAVVGHSGSHSLRHHCGIEAFIRFWNDKTILAILDDVIDG